MKYSRFFIIMLILVVLGGLSSLISPFMISYWNRQGISLGTTQILLLLGVLFISLILELFLVYLRERFAKDFNKSTMLSLLRKYVKLEYDYIQSQGPTKLMERMVMAVNSLYTYMTGDAIRIWSSILVMTSILLLVLTQNFLLFILLMLMIPINYFGFKALNKELQRRSRILQENTSSGWQRVLSFLSQTDYIKQCPHHEEGLKQLEPALKSIYGSMANINVYAQSTSTLLTTINQITQTMIMVLVVYQVVQQQESGYFLILYTILIPLYFSQLSRVTNANLNKREMVTAMEFVNSLEDKLEREAAVEIQGVDTLHFNLPSLTIGDRTLSGPVEEEFHKGDIVWVQGASGTGKSTLMKLLPKFRVTEHVGINGIPLKQINNSSLREKIHYLSQQVPIMKGSLRDNLFLNREYSQEEEEKLLHEPLLETILQSKELSTEVDEGGTNLSGGEKQKIALARILHDLGEVLILDEVTSNIDKDSAYQIYKRVTKNHQDRIIFIISHDDMPKQFANRELVLQPVN